MLTKKQKVSDKGFTLMELMIAIGLLVIFTVVTLSYGFRFFDSRTLEEEASSVAGVIERARSNAISGKDDSDWGVQFITIREYNIFKGSSCGSGVVYQTFNLSSGSEIESSIDCIIFKKTTGELKIYE